jgi:hypothetical protein
MYNEQECDAVIESARAWIIDHPLPDMTDAELRALLEKCEANGPF